MDAKLKLAPDVVVNIPERLHLVIDNGASSGNLTLTKEEISQYADKLLMSYGEYSQDLENISLQIAEYFSISNKPAKSLLYLGLFVEKKAQALAVMGNPEEGLGILADVLVLEHKALAYINPNLTRSLTDLLIFQIEKAFSLCSMLGSLDGFASSADDIQRILKIVAVLWDPELTTNVRYLSKLTKKMAVAWKEGFSIVKTRDINDLLQTLKTELSEKDELGNTEKKRHMKLMIQFVDTGLEMLHQEILISSTAKYTSEGLDIGIIEYQTSQLIGKVERRLRVLISKKYKQKFGKSWVQHIEAKHESMFERWHHYRRSDQDTFIFYPEYSPKILEYALLRDLAGLISAQWNLFRSIFDFGYQKRNKAVFNDKIRKIITVRNSLAHHRQPPENELLRSRVLCTDILLSLDQAGEGVEQF